MPVGPEGSFGRGSTTLVYLGVCGSFLCVGRVGAMRSVSLDVVPSSKEIPWVENLSRSLFSEKWTGRFRTTLHVSQTSGSTRFRRPGGRVGSWGSSREWSRTSGLLHSFLDRSCLLRSVDSCRSWTTGRPHPEPEGRWTSCSRHQSPAVESGRVLSLLFGGGVVCPVSGHGRLSYKILRSIYPVDVAGTTVGERCTR